MMFIQEKNKQQHQQVYQHIQRPEVHKCNLVADSIHKHLKWIRPKPGVPE